MKDVAPLKVVLKILHVILKIASIEFLKIASIEFLKIA